MSTNDDFLNSHFSFAVIGRDNPPNVSGADLVKAVLADPPASGPKPPRVIAEIARDIKAHWKKVYFGAVPYLDAMGSLITIGDRYGADDARSIITYFLGNATSWRGDDARRIKAELKALLKGGK